MFYADNDAFGWPRDMVVRVASNCTSLLELLWLRHNALGNAEPTLPPAELPGEAVRSNEPSLIAAWEGQWWDALDHARRVHEADPASIKARPDLWRAPRATALAEAVGIRTAEPVGRWRDTLHDNIAAEYAVAEDLRKAWEAGLRVIIDVPLQGHYSDKVADSTILVSSVARSDPFGYARALVRFTRE